MSSLLLPADAEWAPAHHTKPLQLGTVMKDGELVPVFNDRTLAGPVKIFAENYLRPKQGMKKSEPFRLTAWQHWLLDNVLEINQYGYLRYQTAVIMLPRKNGKTFLAAILCLAHLLTAPNNSEIYSAAVNRTQARFVFDLMKFWIDESPMLQQVLKVTDSKNTIENIQTKSFYRALAQDSNAANGLQPYFLCADEVHVWESENGSKRAQKFWDALTKGSASLPESQFVVISTSGENKNDSLLGSMYKRGVKASEDPEQEDDAYGFFCWEAPEGLNPADYLDIEIWKKANPQIACGLMNVKVLENAMKEAGHLGFTGFLQFHLNVWARVTGETFMPAFHWENAQSKTQTDIKPGTKVTAGADFSYNNDSSAIVIQDYETGFFKIYRLWERPANADSNWIIPRNEVVASIHELFKTYDVVALYADRKLYNDEIHEWRVVYNYPVEAYSQDQVTIAGAAARFMMNITEGKITHSGEEALTRHVLNAIRDSHKTYKKASPREKIDLLAASVMSNAARDFFKLREQPANNKPKQVPSFFGAGRR